MPDISRTPATASKPPVITNGYSLSRKLALLALAVTALVLIITAGDGTKTTLLALGILLGITLFHGSVSFTAAYRKLILFGDGRAVQAQLLMIALATLLFAPALAQGELFGQPIYGALAPVGVQVACGAFIFGIGMQLAGGCGSGTLYTAGSGNLKMLLVLICFCAGSFWGSLDMSWWRQLPNVPAISLGQEFGWITATVVQLTILLTLAWLIAKFGHTSKSVEQPLVTGSGWKWQRLISGPWPLVAAALILALLNFATLSQAGHPWTITWAFSLWGAKTASLVGWVPDPGSFWTAPFQSSALSGSILQDTTSVMNIGLLLGAFIASILAGRLGSKGPAAIKPYIAAIIGGLLLGYGARIAYGCNIGALFSGIASSSLHGWLWIAAALPGNWLGVKLRPWFGLRN
ncbi:MAG: YeeE/YedE family protein [Motiliproteus sp.]